MYYSFPAFARMCSPRQPNTHRRNQTAAINVFTPLLSPLQWVTSRFVTIRTLWRDKKASGIWSSK